MKGVAEVMGTRAEMCNAIILEDMAAMLTQQRSFAQWRHMHSCAESRINRSDLPLTACIAQTPLSTARWTALQYQAAEPDTENARHDKVTHTAQHIYNIEPATARAIKHMTNTIIIQVQNMDLHRHPGFICEPCRWQHACRGSFLQQS